MGDASFTIGQQVVLRSGSSWASTDRLTTVEKITPGGRVRVKGCSDQFRPDGYQFGGDRWHRSSIAPVTPEALERIALAAAVSRARNLAEKLYRTNWGHQPLERLAEINEHLAAVLKLTGGDA